MNTTAHLTFTAHLHAPTPLGPTFSSCKPESIFGTLETVFETPARYLPGVGLTEINPSPVSLALVSLSLDLGGAELGLFGTLEPGALAPWRPGYALLQ